LKGFRGAQPAFLPGLSDEETDLVTELERMDSPPASLGTLDSLVSASLIFLGPEDATAGRSMRLSSMRGEVMALDNQGNGTAAHLTRGGTSVLLQARSAFRLRGELMHLPRNTFSLRGEMMHCFISYRVATEGDAGNGMSGLLADKIRTLSMDRAQELQIPRQGNPVSSVLCLLPGTSLLLCEITMMTRLPLARVGDLAEKSQEARAVPEGGGQGLPGPRLLAGRPELGGGLRAGVSSHLHDLNPCTLHPERTLHPAP